MQQNLQSFFEMKSIKLLTVGTLVESYVKMIRVKSQRAFFASCRHRRVSAEMQTIELSTFRAFLKCYHLLVGLVHAIALRTVGRVRNIIGILNRVLLAALHTLSAIVRNVVIIEPMFGKALCAKSNSH